MAGRLLSDGDDGTGVPPVMVLTHEYWLRQFGGDRGIVGRTVRVDGKPVTVVGVVERGAIAVIIAAVGIAGVLAFSVSVRTNEIGIRMSLGADSRQVQRMVLREGGVLLVVGLALGVAGAFLGTRLISGLLFDVARRPGHPRGRDPVDDADRSGGLWLRRFGRRGSIRWS